MGSVFAFLTNPTTLAVLGCLVAYGAICAVVDRMPKHECPNHPDDEYEP